MPHPSPSEPGVQEISEATFTAFSRYIHRELGIKMPFEKRTMLQVRLSRRVRTLGLSSLEEYRQWLFESPAGANELVHFIDSVTTHKTDFFREEVHFDHLIKEILPASRLLGGGRFNAWCAGCSTGEEPYTLAIALLEAGLREFGILGTDVSARVLEVARRGVYAAGRIDPVPLALRSKYFHRSRDASQSLVRVAPAVRGKLSFHQLNFLQDDYQVRDEFDVIFFRNVAIYFERPTQEAVVNKLCRSLRPGGHLFVGLSETLSGLDVPLTQVGSSVYRKR
jgi:chemotaxis protein methyltransferase CheR